MDRIERTRSAFNAFLHDLSIEGSEPRSEALDSLGFEAFAKKIQNERTRKTFSKLAFEMLEANLLEHLDECPKLKDIRSAESVRSLREWRETLVSWENALHALRRISDA
jgi:hypothetical protein